MWDVGGRCGKLGVGVVRTHLCTIANFTDSSTTPGIELYLINSVII